jgi:hypothetical protein
VKNIFPFVVDLEEVSVLDVVKDCSYSISSTYLKELEDKFEGMMIAFNASV